MNIRDRMRAVLRAEAAAIAAIEVDDTFEQAVETLRSCSGKVLTTLCSGATPTDFIHPAEAAHGDLGLVGREDVMIAFSTSGKSREVLELLELARHLGVATVIGVTSHPDSELRDMSDLVLNMGIIEEPCPLGMTPSASTAVMMAIGDAIALALMEAKGITLEEYGLRHHGGYLGRLARLDNVPHADS
jgi:arabinose-5-phosphate isomerase